MRNIAVGFILGLAVSAAAQQLTASNIRRNRLRELRPKLHTHAYNGESSEALKLLIDEVLSK